MVSSESRAALSILVSQVSAVLVMLVGTSVLSGWMFNVSVLKNVAPNLVSMTANTALCLLATGIVLLLKSARTTKPSRTNISILLAVFVVSISSLTLMEYITHRNFGIDEILFIDDTRTAADNPGRMAPVTAISLVLCNLALLLRRDSRLSRYFAVVVLCLGTLATTGYLFDVSSLYQVIGYTSVAVHTAVSLMLISIGILASRPEHGMVALILSDTSGGEMARRLLWIMPLLLLLLDWLVLIGEIEKFYDNRFGMAASSVGDMALSCIVILIIAQRLRISDQQRQEALNQLAALNSSLELKVTTRTQELIIANEKLAGEVSERKEAEEKARHLSLTDELSGLLNRRGFFLLAEQALKTARRANTDLTLIYIDLDGLKRVNDELGHQAGDSMIIDAAEVLRVSFRESDLVARIGGDEFAILAITTDSSESMIARLQKSILQFNQGTHLPYQLSVSAGHVRCLPDEERSLIELLADADELMYLQKKNKKRAAAAATAAAAER